MTEILCLSSIDFLINWHTGSSGIQNNKSIDSVEIGENLSIRSISIEASVGEWTNKKEKKWVFGFLNSRISLHVESRGFATEIPKLFQTQTSREESK